MKKLIAKIAMVASLLAPFATGLTAQAVVPTWDVSGNYIIAFDYLGTPYAHDMTLVQDGLGNITGNGGNPAGSPHVYTWVLTSGSVVGNTIDFYADYTATADAVIPQTTMHVVGIIAPGGTMTGTWSDNYQAGVRTGNWSTTSGVANAVNSNTVVVRPADMALNIADVVATPTKWFFYNDETDGIDNTLGSFVTGPTTPPAGVGSVQMTVSGTQRKNLATYQFKNVKLSDVAVLSFSTYSQLEDDGSLGLAERAPYLQFNVDFNNTDTWQRRLTFVPALNGAVVSNTWQTWDAINSGNALWTYSGAVWPTTADAGSSPKTWAQILALYPNAETRSTDSFLGFRVGEPYANGFTGNVDNFVFGTSTNITTYDFEPVLDADHDGVLDDGTDLCPGTTEDIDWSVNWGPNRMEVRNTGSAFFWYQNKVVKGTLTLTSGEGIAYTYGCNGHQILQMLKEATGDAMNGHWKYGLSSGLVKEFHDDLADGVLDGMYLLETVTVPANAVSPVESINSLLAGHNYKFKASGTANAGDGIQFDADYSYRTPSSVTWTDAVSTYEGYGDTLLDLMVNGGFVSWDNDSVYNTDHIYWYQTTGSGSPATFIVNDVYAPNNTGNLTVDIYVQL